MNAKALWFVFALLMMCGFAFGQGDTLKAMKVDTAPVLDGDASDAAWAKAPALKIGYLKVSLKAVYTDTDVYLLATWPDATFSIVRGGSWNWDGKGWKTTKAGDPETAVGMAEDRIAFMWSMDTPRFGDVGCMAKCHPGAKPAVAHLENGKADMWHMKAARSLPATKASQSGDVKLDKDGQPTSGTFALVGYCDDKWVGQLTDKTAKDGGRYGDAGKSTLSDVGNYPQNGRQQGELYAEIADKLGVEKAYVVGASEGGFIGTNYALYAPERVEKLVLLGPMGYAGTTESIVRIMLVQFFPLKPMRESTVPWAFGDDPQVVNEFGEQLRLLMAGGVPKKATPVRFTAEQRQSLEVPVLLILGQKDNLVGDPEAARALVQDIPDIRVEVLDTGHLIGAEQPEKVNALILEFLAEDHK